jgi:hypothetical protein
LFWTTEGRVESPTLKSLGKARFLQNAIRRVSGSDLDRHDNPLSLRGRPDIVIALTAPQKRASGVVQSIADRLAEVIHAAA